MPSRDLCHRRHRHDLLADINTLPGHPAPLHFADPSNLRGVMLLKPYPAAIYIRAHPDSSPIRDDIAANVCENGTSTNTFADSPHSTTAISSPNLSVVVLVLEQPVLDHSLITAPDYIGADEIIIDAVDHGADDINKLFAPHHGTTVILSALQPSSPTADGPSMGGEGSQKAPSRAADANTTDASTTTDASASTVVNYLHTGALLTGLLLSGTVQHTTHQPAAPAPASAPVRATGANTRRQHHRRQHHHNHRRHCCCCVFSTLNTHARRTRALPSRVLCRVARPLAHLKKARG